MGAFRRPSLNTGCRVGKYELVRHLGAGGMGTVYEAVHRALNKRVALKLVHQTSMTTKVCERFLRETRAVAQIRHPHVVSVLDAGFEEHVPFLVMELIEGPTLARFLDGGARLIPAQLANMFLPICSAVSAAHTGGVVHRDLKPSNVMLSDSYHGLLQPVVLDFGISKLLNEPKDPSATASGAMLGTLHYMAPELICGSREASEVTDQYALGVMLYECATGARPFEASSPYDLMHAVLTAPVTRPRHKQAAIPDDLENLILRAMNRDPDQRYSSVRALGAQLLAFADHRHRLFWSDEYGLSATYSGDDDDRAGGLTYSTDARVSPSPPHQASLPRPLLVTIVALAGAAIGFSTAAFTMNAPRAGVAGVVGAAVATTAPRFDGLYPVHSGAWSSLRAVPPARHSPGIASSRPSTTTTAASPKRMHAPTTDGTRNRDPLAASRATLSPPVREIHAPTVESGSNGAPILE